jgi:hypothetical protein
MSTSDLLLLKKEKSKMVLGVQKKILGMHVHNPYICTKLSVKMLIFRIKKENKFLTMNKTRNTYFILEICLFV